MSNDLPVFGVVPISQMHGGDEEDTRLLRRLSENALSYISAFDWCGTIKGLYFGDGIGGIFGIFLAHVEPFAPEVPEYLWIVAGEIGEIPPAYLGTATCRSPKEVMKAYILELRRFIEGARLGERSPDVFPFNTNATPEVAELLTKRLDTLEFQILPSWFID
ncbi:MAG TPA: hypothetical protein VF786_00485 [Terriglobales bacterium]